MWMNDSIIEKILLKYYHFFVWRWQLFGVFCADKKLVILVYIKVYIKADDNFN